MTEQNSFQLAKAAARVADDKQGRNIVIMDVRNQTAITDCFVFVGATTHVHVRALEDAIRERMRTEGAELIRTDGQRGHQWRVLDYGSVLIHIMDETTREFYGVERLWDQGKRVPFLVSEKKKSIKKNTTTRKPKSKLKSKAKPKSKAKRK